MIADIAFYLGFLLMFGVCVIVTSKVIAVPTTTYISKAVQELTTSILSSFFLLAMIWMIARDLNVRTLGLLILVDVGAFALGHISVMCLSSPATYQSQITWINAALLVNRPHVIFLTLVATGFTFLLFPVPITILHFVFGAPSQSLTVWSVRLLLVMVFGVGFAMSAVLGSSGLASDSLRPDVRDSLLVRRLIGLIPSAVFLAVLVRIGGDDNVRAFGFTAIVVYALAAVILPYAVGRRNASALRLDLFEARRRQIADLRRILVEPLSRDAQVSLLYQHGIGIYETVAGVAASPDVLLAMAVAEGDRDWAFEILAVENDPYVPGSNELRSQFAWMDGRYNELRTGFDVVRPMLIRSDFVSAAQQDYDRIDRILRGIGHTGLPHDPAGDVLELESHTAESRADPNSPARLEAVSRDHLESLQPKGMEPWATLSSQTDLRTIPESNDVDPLGEYLDSLDFELRELDREWDRFTSAHSKTLLSMALAGLGSLVLGGVANSVASLVLDTLQRDILR